MLRTWLNDLRGSGQAAFKFAWVFGEVAGDVAERELRQDRSGRLALKEEAEGLPHDPLKVVAELEPSPSRSGTVTWWVVSRWPSRTSTRNARSAKGLILMSAMSGSLSWFLRPVSPASPPCRRR